jgi:5-methylcytosine-specific restriction enzyme A
MNRAKKSCSICYKTNCHCQSHRPNPARYYGTAWRKLRLTYLAEYPLCQDCLDANRITEATEIHHLIKPGDDTDLLLDTANLRPLCEKCHSRRTQRNE